MLSLPPSVRIFLCQQPADMRRGFDGLARMTEEVVRQDPFSGHLFVFRNRRRDRVKLLYWDRDGFCIFYKRLERGTFQFPEAGDSGSVRIDAARLAMILQGIDLASVKQRSRYTRAVGG